MTIEVQQSALEEELVRLRRIEALAREAARYHVLGYGDDPGAWDANHMIELLDRLTNALHE